MSKIGFPNTVKSQLEEEISASATLIKIPDGDYPDWIGVLDTDDIYYAVLVNAANDREIVKIKETGSTLANGIAVERGQEGTIAQVWPRGTVIFQDVTAITLFSFPQKEAFRSVAFNPNGALTSDYAGEKVYQSDLQIWWKAITPGTGTEWRLVFGQIVVATPTFSPPAGTYGNGTPITISTVTPGATIYYTTDGSDPDDTDTLYTVPITLPDSDTTTLKAIAYGIERWETVSAIASGVFIMEPLGTMWIEAAGKPATVDSNIYDLHVFGGALYGSSSSGYLYRYNSGLSQWDIMASPYLTASLTRQMTDRGGFLFACALNGYLLRWDNVSAWAEAARIVTATWSRAIINYGGSIYVANGTRLYIWNDVMGGTLTQVAGSIGGSSWIGSLTEYNSKIYATDDNGGLFEWDGISAWVQVATDISPGWMYHSMVYTIDGKLYGVHTNGGLYIWNDSNQWNQVVPAIIPTVDVLEQMCELNGMIFAADTSSGELIFWDGVSATWTLGAPAREFRGVNSVATFTGTIFGGTSSDTKLWEWA